MATGDRRRELKVVVVGDTGVGKSSLMLRLTADTFRPYLEPTIGATFLHKTIVVDDKPIRYQIWDTSGQDKYQSLVPMFYRNGDVAIIVYDITRKQSLESVTKWTKHIQQTFKKPPVFAIVGNKSDLEAKRETPETEVRAYVEEIGALFVETSAKDDGTCISDLFVQIGQELFRPPPVESSALSTIISLFSGDANARSSCW